MSLIATILLIFLLIHITLSGDEVLNQFNQKDLMINAGEIAIVQFDSRPVSNYWNITARWNRHYAQTWGHQYFYFTQIDSKECKNVMNKLGLPWCKVKAMRIADQSLPPQLRYILYMDSDALVTSNHSMSTILSFISKELLWNWDEKPIAFNQDGPGYACKQAIAVGYPLCFNSGIILWKRTSKATEILRSWWKSSLLPLDSTKFPMNWRKKWPWEQAQQYEIYLKHSSSIMVLSFPSLKYLPWTSTKNPKAQYPTDAIEPWCFTHWPIANCFITHFCASTKQKQKMRREYDRIQDPEPIVPIVLETIDSSS